MSKKDKILDIAQEHVFNLFKQGGQNKLIYHNYNHTLEVVAASEDIGRGSGLDKDDEELLLIAAWFHDTGYLNKYKGHEEVSAGYAAEFLQKHNYDEAKINTVTSAIRATQCPQKPKTLLEEVLCDADFAHTGKKDFLEKSQLLRLEWELTGQTPTDVKWPESEINFLSEHKYHTEYAQREFARRKARNILALQEIQLEKLGKEKKDGIKEQKELNKKMIPERGIETMFRVSFRNHMDLSSIADNKANIMLSINAIILSITLSTLVPNFDDNPALIIPTLILILVCVVTIIFATLSTRPKSSSGKFTRAEVKQQKPNLLFFGNFHGMPLKEFEWGMEEMMKSKEFLYGSMIKDFYGLGTVLAKKYNYLRICYNIFMYGMIVAVAAFLIMFLLDQ